MPPKTRAPWIVVMAAVLVASTARGQPPTDAPAGLCVGLDPGLTAVCTRLEHALRMDDRAEWLALSTRGFALATRERSQPHHQRRLTADAVAQATGSSVIGFVGARPEDVRSATLSHQDLCDACSDGPDCFGGCERSNFLRIRTRRRTIRIHFDREGITSVVSLER